MSTTATITVGELHRRHEAGDEIQLIDVRTPAEFEEVHVPYARNVPLDRLDVRALGEELSGQTVYVICRSGSRGKQACQKLITAGHVQVVNVDGGTAAFEAAGLPVVRGRAALSLERQVRIAAGLLVILGVVLGYFVHPVWIALAAFVGAGLVFAGVTDTCGMGLLLARMPWNQRTEGRACGASTTKSCNI